MSGGPVDWATIYRWLWHHLYLAPDQVDQLTDTELALALDGEFERLRPPAGSTTFGSHEERLAWIEARRRMSDWDKYRELIEG